MSKKVSLRRFQLFIIIIICLGIGYLLGNYKITAQWKNYHPILGISNQTPPQASNLNMAPFYEIVERLNSQYYDKSKIVPQKMVYGAINGMLQSLGDPYTAFFPPKQNTEFKTQLAGQFSGIGAELSLNSKNQIIVMAPLDDSPAQKAGLKAGDIIAKVDGKETSGWTLDKAVDVIRGQKGTKVVLTVLHKDDKSLTDIPITRGDITVKSVTSWVKEFDCTNNGCSETENCQSCATIAYLRISQFGDNTNDEWIAAVNKIMPEIQKSKNFKGIVLDLRNNPGGYLNDAVFIASEFIKSGPVVIQEDGAGQKTPLDVNRTGVLLNQPMAVLINGGSASAAEIVSGALQDYGRAKLVGEQSFGKGTVQQAEDLENGASVHISIAKWLTPKGRWVNHKGLTPDVEVKYDATASSKLKDNMDNQLLKAVDVLAK